MRGRVLFLATDPSVALGRACMMVMLRIRAIVDMLRPQYVFLSWKGVYLSKGKCFFPLQGWESGHCKPCIVLSLIKVRDGCSPIRYIHYFAASCSQRRVHRRWCAEPMSCRFNLRPARTPAASSCSPLPRSRKCILVQGTAMSHTGTPGDSSCALTSLCVFCGSSSGRHEVYAQAAQSLGRELADRGITLVYGGMVFCVPPCTPRRCAWMN